MIWLNGSVDLDLWSRANSLRGNLNLDSAAKGFHNGDRVRVCQPRGEYSGCRGTIVEAPAASGEQPSLPLGYMVAVDGENGVARPFLIQHLEPIRLAATRSVTGGASRTGAVGQSRG